MSGSRGGGSRNVYVSELGSQIKRKVTPIISAKAIGVCGRGECPYQCGCGSSTVCIVWLWD